LQSVFIKLKCRWIDFAVGEEIDGTFFILKFYVFVVANEEACFCEFEDVLDVANGTNQLTGSHVSNVHFLRY